MTLSAHDLTGVRFYGFVLSDGEMVVGHVVDDGKASLPIHEWTDNCFSISEAQHALRRIVGYHVDRFAWIEDPDAHPVTKAAIERIRSEQQRLKPEPEPEPARKSAAVPEMAPSETQAREHVCTVCAKRAVCIVADAVVRLGSLYPTVASCGGFEPPPPRDVDELLARLDNG